MRHVTWIFVVLLLCSLTSFVEKDIPVQGTNIGDTAPDFFIQRSDEKKGKKLKELRGNNVLISFWASYDASSRMQNALLNHAIKKMNDSVKMVSVSFDEYASIFNETIEKDGIKACNCFADTCGQTSSTYKKYRLDRGFQNFLLNEKGVIVAKNITADQLAAYFN